MRLTQRAEESLRKAESGLRLRKGSESAAQVGVAVLVPHREGLRGTPYLTN